MKPLSLVNPKNRFFWVQYYAQGITIVLYPFALSRRMHICKQSQERSGIFAWFLAKFPQKHFDRLKFKIWSICGSTSLCVTIKKQHHGFMSVISKTWNRGHNILQHFHFFYKFYLCHKWNGAWLLTMKIVLPHCLRLFQENLKTACNYSLMSNLPLKMNILLKLVRN